MVFLYYEEGSKAYRLYDPVSEKVVVSRDVVFNEAAAWSSNKPAVGEAEGVGGIGDSFIVERLVIHGGGEVSVQPEAGGATTNEGEAPG
jgi:hypothetical protein